MDFSHTPVLRDVLLYLGNKYRVITGKPETTPDAVLKNMVDDLKLFRAISPTVARWDHWQTLHTWACDILNNQQRALQAAGQAVRTAYDHLAFSGVDMALMVEQGLFFWEGCPSVALPWSVVEHSAATIIDPSVACEHLAQAVLPQTVWFEWRTRAPASLPPWVRGVAGVMVSKNALCDAPPEHQAEIVTFVRKARRANDMLSLFETLASLGAQQQRCLGYTVIAVQYAGEGLRFIPTTFGHEYGATVHDMLRLFRESTIKDDRKTKQTEQVWSNIGLRLLLLATTLDWFRTTKYPAIVSSESIPGLQGKGGRFFVEQPPTIRLRKENSVTSFLYNPDRTLP